MKRLSIKKPEEVKGQILEYLNSSEELKFVGRLNGILMLLQNEDTNCSEVARIYGYTPQAIAGWVHRLNKGQGGNIEVLKDKLKTGRNTRLSEIQLQNIKDILKEPPVIVGLKSDNWDGNTLSEYLNQQFGINLQIRQCQRLLQRLGHSNLRGRPWDRS
ncbi:MAG: winged helix-turn-helix domain-containing protein [Ferruginibacter sp.]